MSIFDGRKRIVCHFSAGAASAVATKIAITANAGRLPLEIVRVRVMQEHPDNERFMRDCEAWFGQSVTVLMNEEYQGSVAEVNRRRKYINGKDGAPCTLLLKKEPLRAFARDGDLDVFGYTAGEEWRLDRLLDANNGMRVFAPLIDSGFYKGVCLAMVKRAGIKLTVMYEQGCDHNNCIGCVKGGAWYWNKIRVDYPERFAEQLSIEETIGHPTLRINRQPVWLRDLTPGRGRKHEEPQIECGVVCEMVESDFDADDANKLHRELARALDDDERTGKL